MGHPVMLYHKTEGTPLEGSEARYRVFDSDDLPDKRTGWRDTPEDALKARKTRGDSA